MAVTNSVTLTLGYTGTDFTRNYKISGLSDAALPQIKTKILAYNANVPAADKKVFVSDDYDASDPQNIIGEFYGIIDAQCDTVEEVDIDLSGTEGGV